MNTWDSYLENAMENLEQGQASSLAAVYNVFVCGDRELVRRGGAAIRCLLEAYTMQKIIRLSESFRQYTSMEWFNDWRQVDLRTLREQFVSRKDYVWTLILGSFHPNGYFRESCVRELSEYPDTLPYLILRMNDWVAPVRELSCSLALEKLEACTLKELFLSAPALDKLLRSQRCSMEKAGAMQERMLERIRRESRSLSVWELTGCEFSIRRHVYRILFSEPVLSPEQTDRLLDLEKHSFCQILIITGILRLYPCTEEKIEGFLHHSSACVRRKALEYKYERRGDIWPGLEDMLLDSSYGIRDLAAYYLRRHSSFDIQGFYLSHLGDEKPEIAILGIGECKERDMARELLPFLTASSPKVVRNTLLSIGKLIGEEGSELYRPFLADPRPQVRKAAFHVIRAGGIQYGAPWLMETFLAEQDGAAKKYLLKLLLREPAWKRLPCLLKLFGTIEDQELERLILNGMYCRSLYARISSREEQQILALLDEKEKELPGELVRGIRFDLKFVAPRNGV